MGSPSLGWPRNLYAVNSIERLLPDPACAKRCLGRGRSRRRARQSCSPRATAGSGYFLDDPVRRPLKHHRVAQDVQHPRRLEQADDGLLHLFHLSIWQAGMPSLSRRQDKESGPDRGTDCWPSRPRTILPLGEIGRGAPGTPNLASRPLHATPKRLQIIIFGIFDFVERQIADAFQPVGVLLGALLASNGISGMPLTRHTRSGFTRSVPWT